jgi:hypothetical protein
LEKRASQLKAKLLPKAEKVNAVNQLTIYALALARGVCSIWDFE